MLLTTPTGVSLNPAAGVAGTSSGAAPTAISAKQAMLATNEASQQAMVATLGMKQKALQKVLDNMPEEVVPPTVVKPTTAEVNNASRAQHDKQQRLEAFLDQHKATAQVKALLEEQLDLEFSLDDLFEPTAATTSTEPTPSTLSPSLQATLANLQLEAATTSATFKKLSQAREDWKAFDTFTALNTVSENRMAQLNQQITDISEQLQTLQEAAAAAVAPPATPGQPGTSVATARVNLVQGYVHQQLGIIITPSLAIYYTVRAILEGRYQIADALDEANYRRTKPDEGMSLSTWGGKMRLMSQCYPNLSDEIHRSIYLEGIPDLKVKNLVADFRLFNPDKCQTLEEIIQQTEITADTQMKLLKEQTSNLTNAAQRLQAEARLVELSALLSGKGGANKGGRQPPSSSSAAAGSRDRGGMPRAAGKVPTAFTNTQQYSRYMLAPCILHPNSAKPHSNGECMAQKPQLKQAASALMAFTTPMVGIHNCPPHHYSSSSSSAGPSPYRNSAEWGMVGHSMGPPSMASSLPSGYSTLPPSCSMAAGWQPGMDYSMAATTVRQQREQEVMQAAANRPQAAQHQPDWQNPRPGRGGPMPGRGGPAGGPGRGRGGPPGHQHPLDGGLELPPPPDPHANCDTCGRTSHHPLPCAFRYPHLAPPHFRAPLVDGYRPDLYRIHQEGMRKMPPGMRMGGKLAPWLQRYRQQLTPAHQQRIQDFIASHQAGNPRAAVAEYQEDFEYGYVTRTSVEQRTSNPPLFINQPPPVIVMPRGTYDRPDWREYAAAFPLSFNQTGVVGTSTDTARSRLRPGSPAQPPSPGLLRELVEQMQDCLQRAKAALDNCNLPPGAAGTSQPAVAAAASATPGKERRVHWSDELIEGMESSPNPLAAELQQLMQQHGVKPGSSDPTGLYSIRLQLTKERRYTLDRFENKAPQTGFSLLLPGGYMAMPSKAISDSGCTFSLVDKDWADQVGWKY